MIFFVGETFVPSTLNLEPTDGVKDSFEMNGYALRYRLLFCYSTNALSGAGGLIHSLEASEENNRRSPVSTFQRARQTTWLDQTIVGTPVG